MPMAKKTEEKKSSGNVEEGKVCAVLAYLLIGIIWYFVDEKMKKNSFVKYHVKQGLVLLILSIAVSIVGSVIPFIGWFIILPLGNIAVLVLVVLGIINSVNGKEKELPVIGQFASKFSF
jgi:uncharacterized membrane protein